MKACWYGRLPVVREFLAKVDDLDPNATDNSGQTGFMLACGAGELEVVRELLAKVDDLDPNAKDNEGMTAFMCACALGHLPVVRELLNTAQCDTEAKDNNGKSGYDLAVEK